MTPRPEPAPSLAATEFLDHDDAGVRALVDRVVPEGAAPARRAAALYLAVRDGVRYEVYGADLSRAGLAASAVLRRGAGMCLHKSVLYAAALRTTGIPSRLVLTDVRNHLASDRLRALVGGDVFRYHCLVSVRLGGRWLKATPVFNKVLCRLYRMDPLEFDGTGDSMYHPFDRNGRQHMEFLRFHGEFDDLPYDEVVTGLRAAHPGLFATPTTVAAGSLVADAARLSPTDPEPTGAPR